MIRAWRIKELHRTVRRLAVLLAVFSLAGAACGGDETTSAEEGVAETEASDTNTEDDAGDDQDDAAGAADDGAADEDAADSGDDSAADDGAGDGAEDDGGDGAGNDGGDGAGDDGGGDAGSELPNACPAEGCEILITDAEPGADGEIQLTFDANFTPDFERNHIHVFWDSQEPGAVSSDYEAKGYDVQGKWHPTDEYPVYQTQSDASVDSVSRESSTTICVTAADTDHAVIDATIVDCKDVADLLGS